MIGSGVCGERIEAPASKTKASETPDIADLAAYARSLGYRYEETKVHTLIIRGPQSGPDLLAVRVHEATIDYSHNVQSQLEELLSNSDVTAKASALGVRIGPFYGSGFVALGPQTTAPRPDIRHYADETLIEILTDALSARQGLVWVYRETRCNGKWRVQFLELTTRRDLDHLRVRASIL